MAQFRNMYKVELNEGAAPVVSLKQMYYGNDAANRVGAIVTLDGLPYPLTGGQCAGTAILPDGSTVPLTGTVSGNQAYVELDSTCYSLEGQISVFVAWVSPDIEVTLLAAVGTVVMTETGVVIQPSTPVPDLAELMAAIEDMEEATAAAEAAASKSVRYDTAQQLQPSQQAQARANILAARLMDLATPFSASEDYAAGDAVLYDGQVYVFTSAHSAGAWTGADVTGITLDSLTKLRYLRYDRLQSLTSAQKATAKSNLGISSDIVISQVDSENNSNGMYIQY